jgi:hypothetical protein
MCRLAGAIWFRQVFQVERRSSPGMANVKGFCFCRVTACYRTFQTRKVLEIDARLCKCDELVKAPRSAPRKFSIKRISPSPCWVQRINTVMKSIIPCLSPEFSVPFDDGQKIGIVIGPDLRAWLDSDPARFLPDLSQIGSASRHHDPL